MEDEVFAKITKLTKLTRLKIVTRYGVECGRGLDGWGKITTEALAEITKLKNLTFLEFHGFKQLTDKILAKLAELKNLKKFDIQFSTLTKSGVANFKTLTQNAFNISFRAAGPNRIAAEK